MSGGGGAGGQGRTDGNGIVTGGAGEEGGALDLIVNGNLYAGTLTVGSGDGGDGGRGIRIGGGFPAGGDGGKGGDVNLTVTGTLSVTNELTLTSGQKGHDGTAVGTGSGSSTPGQGGLGGALTVNVGTLEVKTQKVTLALNGTVAWDGTAGVLFETIDIAHGSTLAVTRTNSDDYTFNTLNVHGKYTDTGSLNAAGKTLNFYLPSVITQGEAFLTVAGKATIDETSAIALHFGGSQLLGLRSGDRIIFIGAGELDADGVNLPGPRMLTGTFVDYLITPAVEGNEVVGRVKASINPNARTHAKPLSESFLSGTAFLDQGADFLVSHGIPAMLRAQPGNTGLDLFALLGGSHLRYKTGSHVDLNSETVIVGISATRPLPAGQLTVGPFIEYGEANFNTHNRFPNTERVRGSGEASYTGAGLFVHLESNETDAGHAYAQAAAHGGKIKLESDFDTADLPGTHETRSTYGSGHLALGYVARLTDRIVFELYGQTLWSHQAADTVKLGFGEVKFDPVTSRRTRLGARWTHTLGPTTRLTLGAAWEREHEGKAKARFYIDDGDSVPIEAPKLKGDTGVFEAGFTVTPTRTSLWTVEFGVQGHVGQRQGVTGSIRVNYGF
jgi:hypothetical protein